MFSLACSSLARFSLVWMVETVVITCLFFGGPANAEKLPKPENVLGRPNTLIVAADLPAARRDELLRTAQSFYLFWNTGDAALLSHALSPKFIDQDLPPGRPQGPAGPLFAIEHFKAAVPDLHCEVLQQIVAGDRVISQLRFTGHFSGTFGKLYGAGQRVDFVATDILRINESSQITDNWHLEDNLTFLKQIGAVAP